MMNKSQKSLYKGYKSMDPDLTFLGHHRSRPVIYTYLNPPGPTRSDQQHVVILLKNGQPGDLPSETWEEDFVFDGELNQSNVRAIVEDWLSWSIRN